MYTAHFIFQVTFYLKVDAISPILQNQKLRSRKLNKFSKTPELVSDRGGIQTHVWFLIFGDIDPSQLCYLLWLRR